MNCLCKIEDILLITLVADPAWHMYILDELDVCDYEGNAAHQIISRG